MDDESRFFFPTNKKSPENQSLPKAKKLVLCTENVLFNHTRKKSTHPKFCWVAPSQPDENENKTPHNWHTHAHTLIVVVRQPRHKWHGVVTLFSFCSHYYVLCKLITKARRQWWKKLRILFPDPLQITRGRKCLVGALCLGWILGPPQAPPSQRKRKTRQRKREVIPKKKRRRENMK